MSIPGLSARLVLGNVRSNSTQEVETISTFPHLAPAERRNLSEEVVERLREALVRGDFAPEQPLKETQLAETLQVSRGPIREALVQLEREGLVILRKNRGATVARLSRQDLEEVYTLRIALECLAVKRAVERGSETAFDAMEAVVKKLGSKIASISVQEDARLDIQFHDLLYRAAQHERLYRCWSDLKPQIYRLLLTRNVVNPDFRQTTIKNHSLILEVLRDRNPTTAADAITDHIWQSYVRIVARYDGLSVTKQ